jgi:hypothetical protein
VIATIATPAGSLWSRLTARYDVATPEEAVRHACRNFVAHHGADAMPLRLDTLLYAVGARKEVRRLPVDGLLETDRDGAYVVVVDERQHWARQRFTLAHELAHVLLFQEFADDTAALKRLRSQDEWRSVERLCNAAAAELLMPSEDLATAIRRWGLGPDGLSHLHARYAVSWAALLVRVSEVLRAPATVFRHHARHNREEERWRVHRHYGAALGIWLPEGMTTRHLSSDIVAAAASAGTATVESGFSIDLAPAAAERLPFAASLTAARRRPKQRMLFDHAPEEPSPRWDEVVLFLREPTSATPPASASETPQGQPLTLW